MTLHEVCEIEQEILKTQERIKKQRESVRDGKTTSEMGQYAQLGHLYSKLTECRSILINMRLDL